MKDRRMWLGLLSPPVALTFISVSIAIHPWFDWNENALSDLGATGTGHAWVFNIGLILAGTFAMAFSTYLIEEAEGTGEKAGAILFFLASLSMALIGIFPEGTSPHFEVSALFYLLSVIAMSIYGVCLWRRHTPYGPASLVMVALGMAMAFIPGWTSAAIPEAIGAVAIGAWVYMMIYAMEKGGI